MTEYISATQAQIGASVAVARQARGMTQRDLALALGISLWTVDSIERGTVDAERYLPSIAELTHARRESFTGSTEGEAQPRPRRALMPHLGVVGRDLVLGSIVALVTIRFFTEVVPVVPRAANFIDIPIFLALAVAGMTVPPEHNRQRAYLPVAAPALAFLFLSIASVLVNSHRAAPAPVLVFIYGFLAPLGVYAAAYQIWPPGNARTLSRVLVGLGLLQLAVVGLVSIPRFIASGGNPDFISGTFGTNQYQLVFFLLVVAALLAGIFTFEPQRALARLAPALILAILAVVLLAQWRAILVTIVVTIVALGSLLGRRARGIFMSALAVVSFAVLISVVGSHFPRLKLDETVATLSQSPSSYAEERYKATRPVRRLYGDDPLVGVIGVGPGTFSSRAWQTFAAADSASQSNVQGGYAQSVAGGLYSTDVSDKYVKEQVNEGDIFQGSAALAKPYSSYLGLLAEVGIVGLMLIVAVYLAVLLRAGRLTRAAIASSSSGDSLAALAVATTIGFLTLLQMGVFENWLEVTRLTFIVWLMFAVVAKEIDSRSPTAI